MKTMFAIIALLSLSTAYAAPRIAHVPERLDDIRPIVASSAAQNHIAVVNVANAVAPLDWTLAVTYAVSRIQLNVWTNALAASIIPAAIDNPALIAKSLGPKAKVVVFVEDKPGADAFVSVPGAWCRVNVAPLKSDKPDTQTLRDRYAKAILKGFAYASGSGAALDARSSTNYDTFTLAGMDKTSITISPDSYFPMLEVLRLVGGDEILTPAVDNPAIAQ